MNITIDRIITEVFRIARTFIHFAIIATIILTFLKMYGFNIPFILLKPEELIYIAGAYWLIK